MMEIVEEEYQQFLQDMEDGSLVFGRYISQLPTTEIDFSRGL